MLFFVLKYSLCKRLICENRCQVEHGSGLFRLQYGMKDTKTKDNLCSDRNTQTCNIQRHIGAHSVRMVVEFLTDSN